MKHKYMHGIIFIFAAHFLLGQDTVTVYFNKDGNIVNDKEKAIYYRKGFKDNANTNLWKALDYFKNNKLRATGTFTSKKLDVKQGHFNYFFENGQKKSEGEYKDNKAEGLWLYYTKV